MKKSVYSVALCALVLCSCTKESFRKDVDSNNDSINDSECIVFTASAEQTKVSMDSQRNVSFAANDEISIFAEGDPTNYHYKTTSGGAIATFAPVDASAPSASKYYALYPYQSGATISEGVINGVTINSGTEGTGTGKFNSRKCVVVAVSSTTDLHFKHVMSLLKVTVPAEVTDLKQIYAFNRTDNNQDKAMTGTVNITPSEAGSPSYTVASASNQSAMSGPNGSSYPIPAGVYYIPVLPGNATKGIDLKLVFQDGFEGRMFNGNALDMEPGHVYNLGTIVKTREFKYNTFENGNLNGEYTGNTGAMSVVENPYASGNGSNYVLREDMSSTNGANSGYFQTNISALKFPSGVRSFYKTIKMKVYLGNNAYYPRIRFNKSDKSGEEQRPARINGHAISVQSDWDNNVEKDAWNIIEWDASQFNSRTDLGALSSFQVRPFVDWEGAAIAIGENSDHIVYFDDISFVLISSF